jgi:hypothetical protein
MVNPQTPLDWEALLCPFHEGKPLPTGGFPYHLRGMG